MSDRPELRDLVGEEVTGPELETIGQVDALLRATRPAPEAPATLMAAVLAIPGRRSPDRRRLAAGLALAAALAAAAFGVGLWASGDDAGPVAIERIVLQPRLGAPQAQMTIEVLPVDDAGNWAMLADVSGLEPLPDDGYYELWLTEGSELVASCGRFAVGEDGAAEDVWLNAPYAFEGYDRWVVTAHVPGEDEEPWLLEGPVVVPT